MAKPAVETISISKDKIMNLYIPIFSNIFEALTKRVVLPADPIIYKADTWVSEKSVDKKEEFI